MWDKPAPYVLVVLGTVVGLAILLYGTFVGNETLVPAGGVVVLASIGLLTYAIAAVDGDEEAGH